ncbi:hypothetical protein GOODEAATRI_006182 [Goodea atripinnis]|uniref:Uncharacterized protein n=1 Tax=Goodea atripinnis TaxID=208336 RepID=A0ABV0NHX2_9TELE
MQKTCKYTIYVASWQTFETTVNELQELLPTVSKSSEVNQTHNNQNHSVLHHGYDISRELKRQNLISLIKVISLLRGHKDPSQCIMTTCLIGRTERCLQTMAYMDLHHLMVSWCFRYKRRLDPLWPGNCTA